MTNFKLNPTTGLLNDGSGEPPKLMVWLNLNNLADLPPHSQWPQLQGKAAYAQLFKDGFTGVQLVQNWPVPKELPYCGLDRINSPSEADAILAVHADRGDACITIHAGWGLEDEDESAALVEAILNASERQRLPVFLETHRATITQDIWRTVQLTKRFPNLRFNGDFSHYYCGQEMPYGGMEMKLKFLDPVFSRIGFMHGRIASSGCMQVPIDDISNTPRQAQGKTDYLSHFKEMWIRCMAGFLNRAAAGDVLIFAPELLSGRAYYARLFPDQSGNLREESDRYAQAKLYIELATACFAAAQSMSHSPEDPKRLKISP